MLTLIVTAHSHTPLHRDRGCMQAAPLTRATSTRLRERRANASDAAMRDVQWGGNEWKDCDDKARERDDANKEADMRGEEGGS